MGDGRLTSANEEGKEGQKKGSGADKAESPAGNNLTFSDVLAEARTERRSEPSSNSGRIYQHMLSSEWGRGTLVLGETLKLFPQGIANGISHNIDHPGEFFTKMGVAASFGVGLRLLLPKAGAARALAGTVMSYFMARDVAGPLYFAVKDVSSPFATGDTVHKSAVNASNALGLFTVDMAAGLPVGIGAERMTGWALTRTRTGRAFEVWKEDFYNSDQYIAGRFFNSSTRFADRTTDSMAEWLAGKQQQGKALSIDEKLRLIQQNLDHHHARHGALPSDVNPQAKSALDAYLARKRQYNKMQDRIEDSLGESAGLADGVKPNQTARLAEITTPAPVRRAAAGEPPPPSGETAPTSGKTSDTPAPTTPESPQVKADAPETVTTPKDLSGSENVGRMATTVRDQAAKTTQDDMAIADFVEGVQSPLTQTMRTGKPPLDEGHWANNQALIELAGQVKTVDHLRQAGFLLDKHRVANVQMGIPERMPEIVDLNQYSRWVHKNMMDLFRKAGVRPEDVLRGTNSPIFLITDSQGAGPYTIPAIKGVTDTAVIVLPREYARMLGVHVAGIYPHELGHDLIFGDILRFPQALRDHVLKDEVVRKAMAEAVIGGKKGIADVDIEVPGVGTIKKSDLMTELLRAQANENTADIFGSSIDPNTGLSLAVLLGSLRKSATGAGRNAPGQLETRSMYGREFVEDGNPLGIEPHGVDRWRLKLSAETLRQLSNGDKRVGAFADSLDKLADAMSRPSQNYVWANVDQPGKFISLPVAEWDAIIPAIVRAQLNTPLPALNGKAWKDVLPNMAEIYPRVDSLADAMAGAARAGEPTVAKFNKEATGIDNVYSAGLLAWKKALDMNPPPGQPGHIRPEVLLDRMNTISSSLTAQYRGDNYLPPSPAAQPISLSQAAVKTMGAVSTGLGKTIGMQPKLRQKFVEWAPYTAIYGGVSLTDDVFEAHRRQAPQPPADR